MNENNSATENFVTTSNNDSKEQVVKAKTRLFAFTKLLNLFITYYQNVSGFKGEEISAFFGHQPSWFSDFKTGKRKQLNSNTLVEIMAFGYNYELDKNENTAANNDTENQYDRINVFDAGASRLSTKDTIHFYDYIINNIAEFFKSISKKHNNQEYDLKDEIWLLIMLFEYVLVDINGPHKLGQMLQNLFHSNDPNYIFSLLGKNENLPRRYKTKYFKDPDTKEPTNKESIIIDKNYIYAECSKDKTKMPLFFVNYDLIDPKEYKKNNSLDGKEDIKDKDLPDGCKYFKARVDLYRNGRIRLMDLFTILYRENFLVSYKNEYATFLKTCKQLYERGINTFYHISHWLETPNFPTLYKIQKYDFKTFNDEEMQEFLGLIDCFEKMEIPQDDADFTLLKNNFLKLRRTFLRTVAFDFSFVESLTGIQRQRLYDQIAEVIADFKKNPDGK